MLGTFSEFLGYVTCVAALSGELVFLSLGVTGTVHFTIPLPEVASLLGWLVGLFWYWLESCPWSKRAASPWVIALLFGIYMLLLVFVHSFLLCLHGLSLDFVCADMSSST